MNAPATKLCLATGDGPVLLTQHDQRWRGARPIDVRSASCIAVDRGGGGRGGVGGGGRAGRVFCTTARQGVWRSDDAGVNWQKVFEGIPHDRISSVAVSPIGRVDGQGVVYVGTEPSAVFRSEDGGQTWRKCDGLNELPSAEEWSFPPRPQTHHVRWIEPDPHDAGRLYVAIEAGALVRTPDGGATWWDRVPTGPIDTHQLVTHAKAPGHLWSAAGDGFFESDDSGDSWRKAEEGLQHRYCWSVAIDPRDPGSLVLSAASGPRQAHDVATAEAHLYRRASAKEPWQEVRRGLPDAKGTRTYALCADPAEAGVFYAGADGAVYRSADAGQSWRKLEVEWPDGYTGARIHVMTAC